MGQKVNPIGLRLILNKKWQSRWYANKKEFTEEINIDVSLLEQLGSDTYIHFFKDIKPVQTEAIEEILADEGEDISVLGTQTKFIARINPNATIEDGQNINLAIDPPK